MVGWIEILMSKTSQYFLVSKIILCELRPGVSSAFHNWLEWTRRLGFFSWWTRAGRTAHAQQLRWGAGRSAVLLPARQKPQCADKRIQYYSHSFRSEPVCRFSGLKSIFCETRFLQSSWKPVRTTNLWRVSWRSFYFQSLSTPWQWRIRMHLETEIKDKLSISNLCPPWS